MICKIQISMLQIIISIFPFCKSLAYFHFTNYRFLFWKSLAYFHFANYRFLFCKSLVHFHFTNYRFCKLQYAQRIAGVCGKDVVCQSCFICSFSIESEVVRDKSAKIIHSAYEWEDGLGSWEGSSFANFWMLSCLVFQSGTLLCT